MKGECVPDKLSLPYTLVYIGFCICHAATLFPFNHVCAFLIDTFLLERHFVFIKCRYEYDTDVMYG